MIFKCKHCGNEEYTYDELRTWVVLRCSVCNKINVWGYISHYGPIIALAIGGVAVLIHVWIKGLN